MTDAINIKIEGLEIVVRNLDKIGGDLPRHIKGAGEEAADSIIKVRGLKPYPPLTKANQPPPPYYIRGRGMQVSYSRNLGNSEELGTKGWYTKPFGRLGFEIGNSVSYAEWVHGERQARAMKRIGWRKLSEVAKEKTKIIEAIYNKWVNILLERHKL